MLLCAEVWPCFSCNVSFTSITLNEIRHVGLMSSDEPNDPFVNNGWHRFLPYIDGRPPIEEPWNYCFSFGLCFLSCSPIGGKVTKQKDECLKLARLFFISPPMQYVVASCHHLSARADSTLLPQCKLLAAVWMNIWIAPANDFACVATCSVHARFEPLDLLACLWAGG